MNVKFNVFTKASNECDPRVDGNNAPSGVLRVVPFEDPLQLILLLLAIGQLVYVYFGFKGASTSKVIGARNEMMMDDYDGQMIFGDLVGLKHPDIHLTGEVNPQKKTHTGNLSRPGIEPGPAA